MSDKLTDLYPIPVEFVPGQQPTASFLNAWANQIDVAFDSISKVIGDFAGEDAGSSPLPARTHAQGYRGSAMIPNLTRIIGNIGWLSDRLPAGEEALGIQESLVAFDGKKEALLSFVPADIFSAVPFLEAKKKAWPDGIDSHSDTTAWMHNGRQIRTLAPLSNDVMIYTIDTRATFAEGAQNESGHTVIPSLPQIAANGNADAQGYTGLCSVTLDQGSTTNGVLEFPTIDFIFNPSAKGSLAHTDTLRIEDGSMAINDAALLGAELRWWGATPKYKIPTWISNLTAAEVGSVFPEGVIALWELDDGKIRRVNGSIEGIFVFKRGDDNSEIRIEAPDGISLAGGENRYIVAFAGTSVTEGIAHNKHRIADHRHDGSDESAPIDAASLKNRFDHANYTHSMIDGNHFPQYLHRGGYDPADILNGYNVLMGDLVLGPASFAESNLAVNPTAANAGPAPSRSIYFADVGSYGPRLTWKDISTEPQAADDFASSASLSGRVTLVLDSSVSPFYPPLLVRSGELYLGSNSTSLPFTKGKIVFSPHSADAVNTWTNDSAKKNLVLQFNAGTVNANAAVVQYKRLSLLTDSANSGLLEKTGTELEVGQLIGDSVEVDRIAASNIRPPSHTSLPAVFTRMIPTSLFQFAQGLPLAACIRTRMDSPETLGANALAAWKTPHLDSPRTAALWGGGSWVSPDHGVLEWIGPLYQESLYNYIAEPAAGGTRLDLTLAHWFSGVAPNGSSTCMVNSLTDNSYPMFSFGNLKASIKIPLGLSRPTLTGRELEWALDQTERLYLGSVTVYYRILHNNGMVPGTRGDDTQLLIPEVDYSDPLRKLAHDAPLAPEQEDSIFFSTDGGRAWAEVAGHVVAANSVPDQNGVSHRVFKVWLKDEGAGQDGTPEVLFSKFDDPLVLHPAANLNGTPAYADYSRQQITWDFYANAVEPPEGGGWPSFADLKNLRSPYLEIEVKVPYFRIYEARVTYRAGTF